MIRSTVIAAAAFLAAIVHAHDTFEITLEIQVKRKTIEAELEMSRSTAVAATDPTPSNGVLFDPSEFPEWKDKFQQAAPELIQILNTYGELPIKSTHISLGREDDVVINYVIERTKKDLPTALTASILNRFPPDGYGVRVSYRDATGRWYPPFMIFVDKTSSALPPRD